MAPTHQNDILSRSAFGKVAVIGELYDARNEIFSSRKAIKETPKLLVHDTPNTDIQYSYSEKISDRFKLLNVEGELQLSILLGALEVKGNAKYLNEEKASERSVSASLFYSVSTICEKWVISNEHRDLFEEEAIDSDDYTHLVVGIYYGAKATMRLESKRINSNQKQEAQGALSGVLKRAVSFLQSVEVGGSLNHQEGNKLDHQDFSLKVLVDVGSDTVLPTTIEEALQLMKNLPLLLKSYNNGKGIQLTYDLMPISVVRKICQSKKPVTIYIQSIDDFFSEEIINLFEEISETKRKLVDIETDLREMEEYFEDHHLLEVKSLIQEFKIKETALKETLRAQLVDVRCGRKSMGDLYNSYQNSQREFDLVKYKNKIVQFWHIEHKIKIIRNFMDKNIEYLPKTSNISFVLSQKVDHDVYVLTICDYLQDNDKTYSAVLNQFLSMSVNQIRNSHFVVVDLDITKNFKVADKTRIIHYKNGREVCADKFEENLFCIHSNLAISEKKHLQEARGKPADAVELILTCPGFKTGSCSPNKVTWLCEHCKTIIYYYPQDDFCYCKCGKIKIKSLKFKCSDASHGNNYMETSDYPDAARKESNERGLKEYNVLILGQSGVGKSTFINSIFNYLEYGSLEEAKKNKLICVIPTSFSVNSIKVEAGKPDSNENQVTGQSATRWPKTYAFVANQRLIRLIDTPGLGDSKGIEEDRKHMRNILDHLSCFKELHAICILMKSNETRLHFLFKFCVLELLSHLHKSAAKNIIFCFTNSRGSFYTPGEASVILEKLIEDCSLDYLITLTETNMFCFDNEAFRYLCTLKHGQIKHKDRDLRAFGESWNIAFEETKRLILQLGNILPHKVKDSTTLCNTRRRILSLTKPMAEVSKTIEINIARIKDLQDQVKLAERTHQELKDDLKIRVIVLNNVKLDYPRTVCTNAKCVKLHVLESQNRTEIEYVTHCHKKCYLTNVIPEKYPNPALLECDAMKSTKYCRNCGCSWEHHMHVTFDQIREEQTVEDSNVKENIQNKEKEKFNYQKKISEIETLISEFKAEQSIIIQTCAKFTAFLKRNAICPFNDSFKDYLNYLIRLEEIKNQQTRIDRETMNGLKSMLTRYEEEQKVLENALNKVDSKQKIDISVQEISRLERELYKLKLVGAQISNCMNYEYGFGIEVSNATIVNVSLNNPDPLKLNEN